MKVEAELTEEYKFEIQNKCSYLGQYYGEDDWQAIIYALTEEKLARKVAKRIISSGIDIDRVTFSKVKRIKYNGECFDLQNDVTGYANANCFLEKVLNSDLYKRLLKREKEKQAKAKEQKAKKDAEFLKEHRKHQYELLKKEFGK